MIVFSFSLPFQVAHAEAFRWGDEKGGAHFTEDPETIPEKYRDQAQTNPFERAGWTNRGFE